MRLAAALAIALTALPAAAQKAEDKPFAQQGNSSLVRPKSAAPLPIGVYDSEQAVFRVSVAAEGLVSPWGIAALPGGDLLITEKGGPVKLVRGGKVSTALEKPADLLAWRQAGMHDIVLDPGFASNRFAYVQYVSGVETAHRPKVVRYRLASGKLVEPKVIYESKAAQNGPIHSGGRMAFLADGTLAVSLGGLLEFVDQGRQAQDLSLPYGKIIRINRDGSIPKDNPFVARAGAAPEVWTYGHRNPQGMSLRPGTGELWTVEHGPKGGDEVNVERAGANYGWPLVSYGMDYDDTPFRSSRRPGMEQPAWYWRPSIAPGDAVFYSGDAFPEWRGDLFVAALNGMRVDRLEIESGRVIGVETLMADIKERVRAIEQGPDGLIYLATDNPDGRVLRLEPARKGEAFAAAPAPRRVAAMPAGAKPAAFAMCESCHEVTPGAPPGPGPNLFGIAGRKAGEQAFGYSAALKNSGIVWSVETLTQFLMEPQKAAPGNTMGFAGMRDEAEAKAVADYLMSLK